MYRSLLSIYRLLFHLPVSPEAGIYPKIVLWVDYFTHRFIKKLVIRALQITIACRHCYQNEIGRFSPRADESNATPLFSWAAVDQEIWTQNTQTVLTPST